METVDQDADVALADLVSPPAFCGQFAQVIEITS
jgi:hypothetical protein